ncbi:Uncharacterised protein [Streptococcus pneumoniae]|nr:Uncharacterised protein [Streptococcus pneumoniae]VLJ08433.1 Uncharacterised protein [Streptococcus pneumoniae]VSO85643.1 Uncharacterised protein [Streptococcus pneumoniae]
MYAANFSKEKYGFLDKKIYQNLSQSNVGKNFLEIYKEIDTKPKNQISKTLVDKSI